MKWALAAAAAYLAYRWWESRQSPQLQPLDGQGQPIDFSTIGGGGGGGTTVAPPVPAPLPPFQQSPGGGTLGTGSGAPRPAPAPLPPIQQPPPISSSTPIPGPVTDFGPHPSTPLTRTVISPATAAYFNPYGNQPSQTRGMGGIGRI